MSSFAAPKVFKTTSSFIASDENLIKWRMVICDTSGRICFKYWGRNILEETWNQHLGFWCRVFCFVLFLFFSSSAHQQQHYWPYEKVIPCFRFGKISTTWLHTLNNGSNRRALKYHYSDVITSAIASQITGVSIACSTVYSGSGQRNNQISASLAFVWGIHRWPVDSTHKGPVTRKMFPFDDVIMFHFVSTKKISNWTLHPLASCPECGIQSEITSLLVMKQNLHIRLYKRPSLYSVYSENYYTIVSRHDTSAVYGTPS